MSQFDLVLLKQIVEGLLLAANEPLTIKRIIEIFEDPEALFPVADKPRAADVEKVLKELQQDCEGRGFELAEIASGFRFQVRQSMSPWVSRLWDERPAKYSRAILETLALIAYRQPITRGDIEEIRGVAVSTNIIKTLLERQWVRVVGHRDVPGRPALYATTRQFLDYFNLKSLEELPSLAEIRDIDKINAELDFDQEQALVEQLAPAAVNDDSVDDTDQAISDDETDAVAEMHSADDLHAAQTESSHIALASDEHNQISLLQTSTEEDEPLALENTESLAVSTTRALIEAEMAALAQGLPMAADEPEPATNYAEATRASATTTTATELTTTADEAAEQT